MPDSASLIQLLYGTRGVVSLGLGVILLMFYRRYGRYYLRAWAACWSSLAIYYGASGLASFFAVQMPSGQGGYSAASIVAASAGYLHIYWLVLGARSLGMARRFSEVTRVALAALAIACGIVSTPLFLGTIQSETNFFLQTTPFMLAWTVALFVSAWYSGRVAKNRGGLGLRLMTLGFSFYGAAQLMLFGFTLRAYIIGESSVIGYYMAYLDFFFLALIGLGMVISLLEEERQASHRALSEVEHLTYHDTLTGLPNRYMLVDNLILATGRGDGNERIALFVIDVDRFKEINDTLGHSLGDRLLQELAGRLRYCAPEGSEIARFGADEFAILDRKPTSRTVVRLASRILEEISTDPFTIGEAEVFATVSIGVSVWPDSGKTAEELLGTADVALSQAKDQGRDRFVIYTPDLVERTREHLALESGLRRALEREELVLYYQPIVRLDTLEIEGVEALIRWNHPLHGLIPPGEFIPLAERSTLIVAIGNWVIRTATREISDRTTSNGEPLTVSINLSARQFHQPDLVETLQNALRDAGMQPGRMTLELTENQIMKDTVATLKTLAAMRGIGLKIAVDDFGTGYSSLEYLRRFPIDSLKIDRAFVSGIPNDESDLAISRAIVAMARSMGMTVVAEGIERIEQMQMLSDEGCERGQGYYFGRPMPLDELEQVLQEGAAGVQAGGPSVESPSRPN